MKQYIRLCTDCGMITHHRILSRGCVQCLQCRGTIKIGFEGINRMRIATI